MLLQVGVGGHTLYGGFGSFGRTGGLLLDRVVEAQVVLADGSLVIASNTSHTDLFWVCSILNRQFY
jgi:FAD/FMN-containing dehydrogenase